MKMCFTKEEYQRAIAAMPKDKPVGIVDSVNDDGTCSVVVTDPEVMTILLMNGHRCHKH
jgi:hypothetical protein